MRISRKAAAGGDGGGGMDGTMAPGKRTRSESLPPAIQTKAEASTGADLSSVRVHDDAESHASCANLDALAYTLGHDIWFGAGQYQPGTDGGDRLIAHEVAHTVQQGATPAAAPQMKLEVSQPGDALEVEADVAADAILAGAPASISRGAVAGISRAPAEWGSTYGGAKADPVSQNGQKASDYKASINTEGGPVLAPASDERNTGGKKVHFSKFRLSREEMLEILTAAWTEGGLDFRLKKGGQATPEDNRKHAEAELEKYIGYCKAALETMMIDTVEAQALFLGHSAGETAFAKMTEGQLDSNQFEDTPSEVKVSTSTAATTEERYKDGTKVMDGPMRYAQPQSTHRGTVDPLGAIDGSNEDSFDKTFIGRGSIQVTHKAGYVQALMFMEKRVEELRAQAAANEFPATKAELTKQADDLEAAANAIKSDPSQAADPKYAFLFSAAHMQASPMVENSAGGYTEGGMSGGAKDRQKSRKMLAYQKAFEILMKHKDEDQTQPGPTPFENWDAGGCGPGPHEL